MISDFCLGGGGPGPGARQLVLEPHPLILRAAGAIFFCILTLAVLRGLVQTPAELGAGQSIRIERDQCAPRHSVLLVPLAAHSELY